MDFLNLSVLLLAIVILASGFAIQNSEMENIPIIDNGGLSIIDRWEMRCCARHPTECEEMKEINSVQGKILVFYKY